MMWHKFYRRENLQTVNSLGDGAIIKEPDVCSGPFNIKKFSIKKNIEEGNIVENFVEKSFHNNG